MKKDDYLWVEKYRPQKIDDVIIPQYLKNEFKGFVENFEQFDFLLGEHQTITHDGIIENA